MESVGSRTDDPHRRLFAKAAGTSRVLVRLACGLSEDAIGALTQRSGRKFF